MSVPVVPTIPGPPVLRRAIPWLVLVAVVVDVAHASGLTGILAALVLLAAATPAMRRRPRLAFILPALAIAFAASRGFVAVRQLLEPAGIHQPAARTYVALGGLACLAAILRFVRLQLGRGLARTAERPALFLATSFVGLIIAGTVVLSLPFSVRRLADVSLLDALFTATSAVCVTGLTVNDPGVAYTGFGQLVLLLLIQLGGVGIMTVAAVALAAGRDAALSSHVRYAESLQAHDLRELRATVRGVIGWTLAIEAIGAVLLWLAWRHEPALAGRSVAWASIFHAVSGFCNAGFALFPGNLELFRDRLAPQLTIMALIILGGFGFPVLRELLRHARRRGRGRLTIHTRVVLAMSASLILGGALLFLLLESGGALLARTPAGRVLDALFLSITARTAGFNTIPMGQLGDATAFALMILMFIGGSPGSTAGGIKTTTAAILVAALRGELWRREPRLFDRTLTSDALRRATAVTALSLALVAVVILGLAAAERRPFLALAFEAVSATGTVGLTMGITPLLGTAAKLLLVVAMFVGRVGPITAALAVGDYAPSKHRLPAGKIPVG